MRLDKGVLKGSLGVAEPAVPGRVSVADEWPAGGWGRCWSDMDRERGSGISERDTYKMDLSICCPRRLSRGRRQKAGIVPASTEKESPKIDQEQGSRKNA